MGSMLFRFLLVFAIFFANVNVVHAICDVGGNAPGEVCLITSSKNIGPGMINDSDFVGHDLRIENAIINISRKWDINLTGNLTLVNAIINMTNITADLYVNAVNVSIDATSEIRANGTGYNGAVFSGDSDAGVGGEKGDSCRIDHDCLSGLCFGGLCVLPIGCSVDADCQDNEFCDAGVCFLQDPTDEAIVGDVIITLSKPVLTIWHILLVLIFVVIIHVVGFVVFRWVRKPPQRDVYRPGWS